MRTKSKSRGNKRRNSRFTAADLFKAIPSELFEQIGQATKVDANVSRLRGKLMLQLLVLGMLQGNRLSTRLLEELYNSQRFADLTGKGDHQTRHSSIAERITNMKVDYFKEVFEWVFTKYEQLLPQSTLGKKIKKFDSTMVRVSSALVDYGMRVGPPAKDKPRSHQIKFTTQMHRGLPKSMTLHTTQAYLSEQTALRQAIRDASIASGDIVVFDAGLTDRKTFAAFDKDNIQFVTRLKSNYRAKTIETHRKIEGRVANDLEFAKDDRVQLYGSGTELIEHDFRLVEVYDRTNCRKLSFVTNIWDLSAMDIARIYRQRWEIEVLFRYLKQELNLTHLLNRSHNGLQIQMYVILITAILLIVYKTKNAIETIGMAKIRLADELYYQCVQPNGVKLGLWNDS